VTYDYDDNPDFCQTLRDAARNAWNMAEKHTGARRRRLLRAGDRLELRAHANDHETIAAENERIIKDHRAKIKREHDKRMRAAGLWLPKIRWGYTPPVKGLALPKMPKRMLSAGKRFRDASDALWRSIADRSGDVLYRFATWREKEANQEWSKTARELQFAKARIRLLSRIVSVSPREEEIREEISAMNQEEEQYRDDPANPENMAKEIDRLRRICDRLIGLAEMSRSKDGTGLMCNYCWAHTNYGEMEHKHHDDCWWAKTKRELEASE
jgi:hypothetical protein